MKHIKINLEKGLNHRHEQIVDWLVMNPHLSLKECAKSFGYTPEWVRMLVRTDAFQATYRQRCEEMRVPMMHAIKTLVAEVAVTGLKEQLRRMKTAGDSFVSDVTKSALASLGYIPEQVQQHQHVHVDATLLAQARERAAKLGGT